MVLKLVQSTQATENRASTDDHCLQLMSLILRSLTLIPSIHINTLKAEINQNYN